MSQTEKFIRRPDYASGPLTEDELARMKEHSALWIARAMCTKPIESDKIVPAILTLYGASGLKAPRVVIVPSPRIMAFAGGFAAAIWWLRKNGGAAMEAAAAAATGAATRDATGAATRDATGAATWAATGAATRAATAAATWDATGAATWAATAAATWAATWAATAAATAAATGDATWAATAAATAAATGAATGATDQIFTAIAKEILGEHAALGLSCAANWANMYQGGNMWAGYDCYLSAARDILGLRLSQHEKYSAWEQCAIYGGFRIMHDEFCMVSDFPEILTKDERNRPHNDTGPSHRWRDGWELYHIHGVRVTEQIVKTPHTLTIEQIDGEDNAEVRRVMIDRYGAARYVKDSGAILVHELPDNFIVKGLRTAKLYRKEVKDDEPILMLDMLNSTPEPDGTTKRYTLRIDPNAYDGEAAKDCRAAMASTWRNEDGSLVFKKPPHYHPIFES